MFGLSRDEKGTKTEIAGGEDNQERGLQKDDGSSPAKGRFLCVLHFRLIGAWGTPFDREARKYAVVYNGEYGADFLDCDDVVRPDYFFWDCEYIIDKGVRIKVGESELTVIFREVKTAPEGIIEANELYTETLKYVLNEPCIYHCRIYDAMESWEFIVSDAPIDHRAFEPGYERGYDGLYHNKEEMDKLEKLRDEFRAKWMRW